MKKQKKCKNCALFVGCVVIGKCSFGAGSSCMVAADNKACKMIVPRQPREDTPPRSEPTPGEAPFCNDFPKCNNAEGCATCREFEIWLADREKNLSVQNEVRSSGK